MAKVRRSSFAEERRMRLSDYKALTFDVYGTLIDWELRINEFLRRWADRNRVDATDTELLGAFDQARAHYQQLRPVLLYPDVLRSSYAYICNRWQKPVDAEEQETFAHSVKDWDPFPDTVDGLKYLEQFYRLGVLSNIDDRSLEFSLAKMDIEFDLIVTAESVGAYKPDYPHFVMAISELGRMGITPTELLHVAQSLRADIRPGNSLGIATAWIKRGRRTLGRTGYGAELAVPDVTYPSVAELADAHKHEQTG